MTLYSAPVLHADCLRTDITVQKQAEGDAVERANLVEKLALRTEEAAQHERNFQQMAELAPCGERHTELERSTSAYFEQGCSLSGLKGQLLGRTHNVCYAQLLDPTHVVLSPIALFRHL